MFNSIRKIPGGLLLIPMFISAIFNTFLPDLFYIGGLTQALLTREGLNYVLGAACFFSGTLLDIGRVKLVIKKHGSLIVIKTIISIILGYLFIRAFGTFGILGISAITFVSVIASTNPSLYLSLVEEYGVKDDLGAFGLLGMICVPAYPMFIYGLSQGGSMDWMPIISTLIPLLIGMALGNLDKNFTTFFSPGVGILIPLMGWSFGTSINLMDATSAGIQGIILVILYYILMALPLYIVEKKILKGDGVVALSMSSIAGMSVSVPPLLAQTSPEIAPIASAAAAQITLGVIITSFLTPYIIKRLYKNKEVR